VVAVASDVQTEGSATPLRRRPNTLLVAVRSHVLVVSDGRETVQLGKVVVSSPLMRFAGLSTVLYQVTELVSRPLC
jgi:hypothetical protein